VISEIFKTVAYVVSGTARTEDNANPVKKPHINIDLIRINIRLSLESS